MTNHIHPLVTDHAVLRYLERKHGLSIAAVIDEMLGDGRAALVPKIGFGKVKCPGLGVVLQVRDGRVVTVKLPRTPPAFRARCSARPARRG